MKKSIFILSLVFTSSVWAHGAIEKIDCQNKEQNILLVGTHHKGNDQRKFDFVLSKNNKTVSKATTNITLTDTFKNQMVIENIKFSVKGSEAHLLIPEIAKEKRPGTGQLKLVNSKTKATLSCQVVY